MNGKDLRLNSNSFHLKVELRQKKIIQKHKINGKIWIGEKIWRIEKTTAEAKMQMAAKRGSDKNQRKYKIKTRNWEGSIEEEAKEKN